MRQKVFVVIAVATFAHFASNWAISYVLGAQFGRELGAMLVEAQETKDMQAFEERFHALKETGEKRAWVQQIFALPLGPVWDQYMQEKSRQYIREAAALKNEKDAAQFRQKILTVTVVTTSVNALAFGAIVACVIFVPGVVKRVVVRRSIRSG